MLFLQLKSFDCATIVVWPLYFIYIGPCCDPNLVALYWPRNAKFITIIFYSSMKLLTDRTNKDTKIQIIKIAYGFIVCEGSRSNITKEHWKDRNKNIMVCKGSR
jgi:hypothetical protein